MSFLERYRLELELLSPVHVGTGELYPAYAYVPDLRTKEVHLLDLSTLLLSLPPEWQSALLSKVASGPKGAQDALRNLYEEGRVPKEAILRTVKASTAFLRTVTEAAEEALLEFRPLPQSPQGPYLPGSSVKGALRTAWLFQRVLDREEDLVLKGDQWLFVKMTGSEPRIRPPKVLKLPHNQRFEGAVLGYLKRDKEGRPRLDLYADPFRAVRLTDSNPGEGFLNRIGIFHPRGAMKGTVLLAETFRMGSRFHFLFRYQPGLAQHKGVAQPIPPAKLVQALRKYYSHVAEWERTFAEEHHLVKALEVYDRLEERLKDPNVFPIRVGFGSGRLAVRLALLLPEDYPEGKEPVTRKTVGSSEPKDGYPLGWAVGRLLPL